jgi:hypothetical protein
MSATATGAAAPASAAGGPPRELTIGDELARIAPDRGWPELLRWPPDTFALTSSLLGDSGAYRFVVCPPPGHRWPPSEPYGDEGWHEAITRGAAAWAETAGEPAAEPPDVVARYGTVLAAAEGLELASLEDPASWETVVAILSLHALADEACVGAGLHGGTPFQRLAAERLTAAGTLARLSPGRVRVLPKLRPPESGITLRSLSHHLAADRSEVETRWYFAPRSDTQAEERTGRLSLLLVPFPAEIHASDFHPTPGPLLNMDRSRYDFFEYSPHEPVDLDDLLGLVGSAKRHVGQVDALVLPEAALAEAEVEPLQERLAAAGVGYLIAGARQPPGPDGSFAVNYAHLGGGDWTAPKQHKHHRWLLDASQVHQYHLGAALDPSHAWWEAIGVPRRSLTFASVSEWLTICPLVCEDLARPDPVTDVIRAVAPTLVVALLLDGPQLASRWPARYASVLADDPGCSVLTLTALGMTQRCQPPGCDPSRVVALWKDPHRGLQQIQLAEGARALALTAHARPTRLISADGRQGKDVPELVLSGLEQIH